MMQPRFFCLLSLHFTILMTHFRQPVLVAKAIMKAMAKDPDERFASVSEFADALN